MYTIKEIPMKSFSKAAVIGSALLTTSSAFALDMPDMSGYYYNAQYAMLDVDISNNAGSGAATSPAVAFEIGKTVYKHKHANVAVEGVLILGLDDKQAFSYNNGGYRYRGGLDNAVGIQLEANRSFAFGKNKKKNFAGFFNLGLMNISTNVIDEQNILSAWVAHQAPAEDDKTGMTWAIGGEYQLSKAAALTISYNNIFDDTSGDSDVEVTSFNFGYKANF